MAFGPKQIVSNLHKSLQTRRFFLGKIEPEPDFPKNNLRACRACRAGQQEKEVCNKRYKCPCYPVLQATKAPSGGTRSTPRERPV